MSGGLVDLSGLTKPATVLIEKISDAVGGVARPWQIKRVAHAEAQAALIAAQSRSEISELEQRGLIRLAKEEGKKQANIEAISLGALPHLTDNPHPENISDDWLTHFFERSRITSDEQMQTLWSRILAAEANKAGSFSRKTVELVSILERSDAELLQRLFSSSISFKNSDHPDGLFDDYKVFINAHGYSPKYDWNYDELDHLETLGFIKFDPISGFESIQKIPRYELRNNNRTYFVHSKNRRNTIPTGQVIFTKFGQELARLINNDVPEIELNRVLESLLENGHMVGCSLDR